ncbi:hypothetical protein JDV02_007716 [Purpureocillium takamizusanense]|uniref:Uncharacterized protein n=1 Tax=Purpureocillium takamizusanense TaxID=2060973 RepID=A0A9Q8QIT1_9HYPO|nr:uncharacterized protein JDV02_007716 [Purpureocillium takamizusanense]UNI21759.1 hypothetical protein JDV02_007716 [Purpureocillium takamizusanense]
MLFPSMTMPLLVALMGGASCVSTGGPRDETPNGLLRTYHQQVEDLLREATSSTVCYKDYIGRLKASKQKPPNASLTAGIHDSDASARSSWVHLDNARKTAQNPKFERSGLVVEGLPDVLDTRGKHQGPYTEALQRTLKHLGEAAELAGEAHETVQRERANVLDELKKPPKDRRIDTSKAVVQMEELDGGARGLVVLGVAVAGVAVAGVITYAPFVAAHVETAQAIEELDEAVSRTRDVGARFALQARSNPHEVDIGMAVSLRDSAAHARRLLQVADDNIAVQDRLLPHVSDDQRAEASAVIHDAAVQVQDARMAIDQPRTWYLWFRNYVRSVAF